MNKKDIALAADIGGSHIALALVTKGKILDAVSIDAKPKQGLRPHLFIMEEAAKGLIAKNGLKFTDLLGFGMALPMLVDQKNNTVLSCADDKYEDATDIDFEKWAMDTFGLEIKLEVDGNAGCLGEWYYGAGKGLQDFVYVILGTGYGSSVILNGRPLRGQNLTAGILAGHMVVNPGGNKCVCPGRGCVEAETGTWALPGIAQKMDGFQNSLLAQREKIDYLALFEDHHKNDGVATKILERSMMYWGASLVNLSYAYNPQKIVMAGGVLKSAEYIIPKLTEFVRKQLWTTGNYPEICTGEHLKSATLLGCYALVTKSSQWR